MEEDQSRTEAPTVATPPKHLPVCQQCRTRKVRCDRVAPVCSACSQLEIPCSLGVPAADSLSSGDFPHLFPTTPDPQDLTLAGSKRRRSRLACLGCRLSRTKCSNKVPCQRCVEHGQVCQRDPVGVRGTTGTHVRPPRQDRGIPPGQQHVTPSSPSSTAELSHASAGILSILDDAAVRRCLDAFFSTPISAASGLCQFLHKSMVFTDWRKGTLESNLLKAIVATGLHVSDELPGRSTATAKAWMREVQQVLLTNVHRVSIVQLQTLVVLIRFRVEVGEGAEVWNLLPIAARITLTMRLNHEITHHFVDNVTRESIRRLVWAIYSIDKSFSGGIDELVVLPPEKMHIRLPCDAVSYQRGAESKAACLARALAKGESHSLMDISAYLVMILTIRNRVLGFSKRVRRDRISPAVYHDEIRLLTRELDDFQDALSPDLVLTPSRLALLAHSAEAASYLWLHTTWLQCYCDLYRILAPGIRESIGKDAIKEAPVSLIEHYRQVCVDKALQLCDLWTDFRELEACNVTQEGLLVASMYQVTQLLYYLRYLLPLEGPHSWSCLKQKLSEALHLVGPARLVTSPTDECLQATTRMIHSLDDDWPMPRPRESSGQEAAEMASYHFMSRYSFIPYGPFRGQQHAEWKTQSQRSSEQSHGQDRAETVPEVPTQERTRQGQNEASLQASSQLTPFQGWQPEHDAGMDFQPGSAFDIMMYGYHDADLGYFLPPTAPQGEINSEGLQTG